MRIDHQSTIEAITRACGGLPSADEILPDGSLAGQVYQCTKALFDNPLAAAAVDAEVAGRSRKQDLVKKAEGSLLESVKSAVAEIHGLLVQCINSAGNAGGAAETSAKESVTRVRSVELRWQGRETSAADVLAQFAEKPQTLVNIGFADLNFLRSHVVMAASRAADLLKPHGLGMWLPRLERLVNETCATLDLGLGDLTVIDDFLEAEGLYSIEKIEALHGRLAAVAAGGASLPLPADDPLRTLRDHGACVALADDVRLVANLVCARLRHGAVRRHVIHRLKTYLERFARTEIIDQLEVAAAAGRRRNPEAVVQGHLDRFIFSEGLFPITHAVAGRGSIDTFFEESRPLFSAAEDSSQGAVLVELKQALGAGTGAAVSQPQVKSAVSDALYQADEYRSHLVANPRWANQDVFAVVAYDGAIRYFTKTPGVLLVYLGDATPSAGGTSLD